MLAIRGRTDSVDVHKVMWTVDGLGLEHRRIARGGPFGGLDTDQDGRLAPDREFPALAHGGVVVRESGATVHDLAARRGTGRPRPEDVAEGSWADRRMDRQVSEVGPHPHVVFRNPARTAPERCDADAVAHAAGEPGRIRRIAEGWRSEVPRLAGAREIPRPDPPRPEAWSARPCARPACHAHVMPPLS